ncbi:MAG: di-trans,poly-cis-decaprenylcistransferase [Alphaproteobacteria bacterium]|nr:di-trans,poly-cis-decaprenylcistransferase [Alphaproteobacteria bacterium]
MQSSLQSKLHVAIIMDGNGRWATRRCLPRKIGHRIGVEAVRRVVEAAPKLGIGTLTLYAFSADNWRRPEAEVTALMGLLRRYMRTEAARLVRAGVRLTAVGRRDRLPEDLAASIEWAETASLQGQALNLRIALDYSSRDAILQAAAMARGPEDLTREGFSRLLNGEQDYRDVDLLIRTSGEQRLSDFLLWECAYSELHFTDRLWPDFGAEDLETALEEFHGRDRRFGGLVESEERAPAVAVS